jgi:hypothetical protein
MEIKGSIIAGGYKQASLDGASEELKAMCERIVVTTSVVPKSAGKETTKVVTTNPQ